MAVLLTPGAIVDKYRIVRQLGQGGMGAVYYAEHVMLDRPAAIKVLHPHIAQHKEIVERFINEARIAAKLGHRNIVGVHDVGVFPGPNDPAAQWYIAFEYLPGRPLASMIEERGGAAFDPVTALHILVETCNGLHTAHEHGLVHRDIKPDNIYVVPTQFDPYLVKILDFGIAKLRRPDGAGPTLTGGVMGTPAYAAPEQLRDSREIDRRADIWSLGLVAFELLTGVRPWGASASFYDIVAQHQRLERAPDPRDVRPDLAGPLASVVARALEPNPSRRFETAKDFARALAEATPMPYSGNGMVVLERYAEELGKASQHSLTVGRPLPAALAVAPADVVTARERPEGRVPDSISDGVPRAPGTAPFGGPAKTISTISGSSGQLVAPSSAPSATRRSRGPLVVASVLAVAAAAAAIFAATRESSSESRPATTNPVVERASTIDAAPAISVVAITTEPPGAEVFVDGVSKGNAPINVELRAGQYVDVRAEMAAHAAASERVRAGEAPATVRLVLMPLVDAAAPLTRDDEPDGKRRDRKTPKKPRQKPAAGEAGFNPDDVL